MPVSFKGDLDGEADGDRVAVGILGRFEDPRTDTFESGFIEDGIERFSDAHLGGISFSCHEN